MSEIAVLVELLVALCSVFQLHEYKSSSHRIFRLNNIAKALKFLEDSNVSTDTRPVNTGLSCLRNDVVAA